jgi:hypothetical protein
MLQYIHNKQGANMMVEMYNYERIEKVIPKKVWAETMKEVIAKAIKELTEIKYTIETEYLCPASSELMDRFDKALAKEFNDLEYVFFERDYEGWKRCNFAKSCQICPWNVFEGVGCSGQVEYKDFQEANNYVEGAETKIKSWAQCSTEEAIERLKGWIVKCNLILEENN